MRKVLCIFGPTATGKSDLAIALAQKIEAEIINVDSALIYREMDIGTAKPSILSRKGVPHHLIDIINPDQSFSVADFLSNVELLLAEIASREKIPILLVEL